MTTQRWKRRLALLVCGAAPLVTTATCDPFRGQFDFYRNDDADYYFYDDFGFGYDYGYEEVVIIEEYDDCFFFDCF